jgi:hypothetical protein
MKYFIISFVSLLFSISSFAFSTCRNATNTVIYKTAPGFQELLVSERVGEASFLQAIDLNEHKIKLLNRVILDSQERDGSVITTSTVKIQVTKNDGKPFERDFSHLTNDRLAVETIYICETITDLD